MQGAAAETGLGQYSTALLNPLASMTNWASGLATGGAAGQIPPTQAFMTQAGPAVLFHGTGKPWASQFDPTTGLITFTNPGNPRQTWQATPGQAVSQGADLPKSIVNQWNNASQQYQAYQAGGGAQGAAAGAGGQNQFVDASSDPIPSSVSIPNFQTWYNRNWGKTVYVNGKLRTIWNGDLDPNQALAALQGEQMSWQSPAGPLLSQAYGDIQQQQAATGQMADLMKQAQDFVTRATAESAKFGGMGDVAQAQTQQLEDKAQQLYGVGYQELSDADKQIVQANALVTMTTTGEGLFPAQQAMIEQARQSERTQLGSTLGGAGLGTSTQLDQLQGAADLAAAATAGQLQQGNIQAAEQVLSGALGQQTGAQRTLGLSQTEQQLAQQQAQTAQNYYLLQQGADKLSLAGQELLAGEQNQLVQQLALITKQTVDFQQTMWTEAIQGYGLMGQIIDRSASSYGISLDAYKSILQAEMQQNQLAAQQQAAQQSADQQATSGLFGSLGSLLGQGGSLLGGLGAGIGGAGAGAFGTVGGLGTAAASAGAAGSLGSLGTGIIGALGGLFAAF